MVEVRPSVSRHVVSEPRALLVDLWDTLTIVNGPDVRHHAVSEVGRILGVEGERFANTFANSFPQRSRGELGNLYETLRTVAESCGATPSAAAIRSAAAYRLSAQRKQMRFREDASPTLGRFKAAGWRIGMITDSTCETEQLWPESAMASFIDVAVFSCAARCSKPDTRLFELATEQLGVTPSQCVYVADGRRGELAAAAALGMRSIKLIIEVAHDDSEEWSGESVATLIEVAERVVGEEGGRSA